MLGLGPMELVLIAVLLFLVFKGKKIPGVIEAFKNIVTEYKKATKESPDEIDVNHISNKRLLSDENHQTDKKSKI